MDFLCLGKGNNKVQCPYFHLCRDTRFKRFVFKEPWFDGTATEHAHEKCKILKVMSRIYLALEYTGNEIACSTAKISKSFNQ